MATDAHLRLVPATPAGERTVEPLWRELVGARLRRLRQRRGLTLADVAGRAGVSPQYLSELERGRKDPSSEVLAAVTGALDLRVLDLAAQVTRDLTIHHRGTYRRPAQRASAPHPAARRGDALLLAA